MSASGLTGAGPIDAAQVERFRADLEALTDAPPSPANRLGLAVSGGADSLALLLLANAAYSQAVTVATVDHGLRPAATGEAERVGYLCRRLGIPHAALRAAIQPDASGNLQDRARSVRYRMLAQWAHDASAGFVATAHHRDDVAETFLMRAARGGGVRSLAAMPAIRSLAASPTLLIRPLLRWSRAELGAIVRAAGIAAEVDPSNIDPRFDRARMRRLLGTTAELPAGGIARAAGNLRDVEEAVEWMMRREVADRMEEADDEVRLRADGLPFEIKRRLVARAIEAVRRRRGAFEAWRETAVASLVATLERGGTGTVADVVAVARPDHWQFRAAPPRRPDQSAADGGK